MLNLLMFVFLLQLCYSQTIDTLKPRDIKCFGVIGDSISAGFSLESHSVRNDLFEYRGKSFPIGGEDSFLTIPNLFSKYGSPKTCASYATTFITYSLDQYSTPQNTFHLHPSITLNSPPYITNKQKVNCNVAISGALSNLTSKMWYNLLLEWDANNCYNDWKLLTVMIGANDICEYCNMGYNNTIYNYMTNLESLFVDIIESSKKIFVNVVSVFDVSLTKDWQTKECEFIHYLINECPCILGRDKRDDAHDVVKMLYKDINVELYLLVKKINVFAKDRDIKFVIQPIIEDFKIYNFSYLSSFDCFHPSEFAHKCMGTILWNNMFLPEDKKLKNMPYMLPLYEPKDGDFLQ